MRGKLRVIFQKLDIGIRDIGDPKISSVIVGCSIGESSKPAALDGVIRKGRSICIAGGIGKIDRSSGAVQSKNIMSPFEGDIDFTLDPRAQSQTK